ncbi:MAG: hypothetical protein CEE43_02270 [Promethearchaeota archaeon Loki_b32]|nr:MAG: hypothetical protein CEE43_02270 [Candidatus Lokiarchaeota archaeon Loki_b32]
MTVEEKIKNALRIKRKLKVKGTKTFKELEVLFDPETYHSVIKRDIAEEFTSILYYDEPKSIPILNKKVNAIGICGLIIKMQDCEIDDSFRVAENIEYEIIIGSSTLLK